MALFFAYLLPLVLPTVVYMLWRIWHERGAAVHSASGNAHAPVEGNSAALPANGIVWRNAPWLWLTIAGIALMAVVMLVGVFIHDRAPAARYVPPHIEGGRVVPGELRPNETGTTSVQEPRGAR